MATLINNARIVEQVYEFGVDDHDSDETILECANYDEAKALAHRVTGDIKMRAVYVTEWMDTL